jgi:hypothetical protein
MDLYHCFSFDKFVKSQFSPFSVILAGAGTQYSQMVAVGPDSGFSRNDDFVSSSALMNS